MASTTPQADVERANKDEGVDRRGSDLAQVDSPKAGVIATSARVLDHPAERSLCFKFDIRILPVLAIMCEWVNLEDAIA